MFTYQRGFSAIEIVLVIIVIAALGFAGWTWWQVNQNTGESQSDSKPAEENTEESEQHPDGFTAYQNQDIGLQMHYPKEWGEAAFEKGYLNGKDHEPVSTYFVKFAGTDVQVRVSPDNWEWTGPAMGIEQPVTAKNFKEIKNFDQYNVTVYMDSDTIATIHYSGHDGNVEFEGHSKVNFGKVNASVVSLLKKDHYEDKKQCITEDMHATPECYSEDFKNKFIETLTSIESM